MTAGDIEPDHCTITVDLGGTNVRAAAVDDRGQLVLTIRTPTPRHDPDPQFLIHLIEAVLADLPPDRRADQAVVGLPGVIDQVHERLVTGVNLPAGWIDKINEDWIADQVGMEVSLANDADLAAVGESEFGAGRKHRDVVYVTVSTGVGAGLVVDSRLIQGSLSGGEVGHTVIDWEAAQRGEPATVEDLGSGTAIDRAAAKAGLAERGADLAKLVAAGSEPATSIWNHAIEAVGIGIANMAWLVAPQIVIIGGGVGRNTDLVLPVIRRQLERFGPGFSADIDLATAQLGDDAALIGGAAWYRAIGRIGEP
ncbi:MAG: ROK family protein [Acidimicrobiia bacterium]|nr:ROK family protein [Acidimicrobiia bacterium]